MTKQEQKRGTKGGGGKIRRGRRRLKPEKGRRKDLRKIDMLITDLQPLMEDAS